MALEGTIKDFGLPDIFQLIGLQRKTGLLTLTSDKENVAVTFENGMVVMADSSAKRLEDRLGHVLVKQGKLGKERLDEALQTQRATLQRLGHVLITGNYITTRDLKEALQTQVSQIVFKVFRWRDGEYHFAPTDSVDYDRENFTPMSADFILMEGIRMVDEWPIIEKKIPSMDIVFRSVVDPGLIEIGGSEAGGDDPLQVLQEPRRSAASSASLIRLTSDEEKVYRKVDGTRTVQQIIDATGLGEFEVCRTLFDLLNRNIISTVGRGVAKEALAGRDELSTTALPGYVLAGVVLLIGLASALAQRGSPFAVVTQAPLLSGSVSVLEEAVTRARLDRLDRAILAFSLWRGSVPQTLQELVRGGLVAPSFLRDPRERPFHYALTDSGFILNAVDDAGKPVRGTLIERSLRSGTPAERP